MQFASIYNNTLLYFHNSAIKVLEFCRNTLAFTDSQRVFTFKTLLCNRRNSVKITYFILKKNLTEV